MKNYRQSLWAVIKHLCCSKQLLVMRTLFFLIISVVSVFASDKTYSQEAKISLHLNDVSIEKVIDKIERKSEF